MGAAGLEEDQELTVIVGRPPAKEEVVRMRNVRAPICEEVAVQTIVVGLLTSLNLLIVVARYRQVVKLPLTVPLGTMMPRNFRWYM